MNVPSRSTCKFRCSHVNVINDGSERPEDYSAEIVLEVDYDDNAPEDVAFSRYTPSGKLEFVLENFNLRDFYVVGKNYRIDIRPWD